MSAMNGSRELAELFISSGCDVNQSDSTGWTPLSWAAREGHLPIVELLVQNGCSLDYEDSFGSTALMYAVHYEKKDITSFLVKSGSHVQPQLLSSCSQSVREAIQKGLKLKKSKEDIKKSKGESSGLNLLTTKSMLLKPNSEEDRIRLLRLTSYDRNRTVDQKKVLDREVNLLLQGSCQCPLRESRQCHFFEGD